MKIIKISLVTLVLFFSLSLSSQYISKVDRDILINLSNNILEGSDEEKIKNNDLFIDKIEEILYSEKSFYEDFEFIKNNTSVIKSENKKIKIISWFMPLKTEHRFFCFIQEMIDKDYNFFFYESNEMKIEEIEKYQTKTVNENNWIGSVYYDIKEYESNKQINYILIGWSGSKSKNYKIIESMFFDKKSQEFKFGYPLFKLNNKILNRYIIKYYLQSKLTLKFYNNETIVFDQLKENDINPIPDGGYNALILKNKKWMLKENFIPKNKIKLKKRKKINNNLFPN